MDPHALGGLALGAAWGISVLWMGGPYLRDASMSMTRAAILVAAAASVPIWRRGARAAAVGLVQGSIAGPSALIAWLAHGFESGVPF